MAIAAALKFVQGALVGAPGQALMVNVGQPVTVANDNDAGVQKWTFTVLDSPPGSLIPIGQVQTGPTPTWVFTPDLLGEIWLIQIDVADNSGNVATDIRAVGVLNTFGRIKPSFKAKAPHVNFGGQTRGWTPYLNAYLSFLDSLAFPALGAADTVLTSTGVALLYKKLTDVNIATGAGIAGSKINPNFGSQALTAGASSVSGLTVTGFAGGGTQIVTSSNTGVLGEVTSVPVANGGTGLTAVGANGTVLTVAAGVNVYAQIVDANVSATAAIAGTKINPNFGAQNVVTTGSVTGGSFSSSGTIFTSSNVNASSVGTGSLLVSNLAGGGARIATVDNAGGIGAAATVPIGNLPNLAGDVTGAITTNLVSQITRASFIGIGVGTLSTTGLIRTPNNTTAVAARNAAGTADMILLGSDASNNVIIGDATNTIGVVVLANGAVSIVGRQGTGNQSQVATASGQLGGLADILLDGNNIIVPKARAGMTFTHVPQTTDTACGHTTLVSQAPFASATGTNRSPGNIRLDIPAPATGGTAGFVEFQFANTTRFRHTFDGNVTYTADMPLVGSGVGVSLIVQAGGTSAANQAGGLLDLRGGIRNGTGLKGGVRLSLNGTSPESLVELTEISAGQRVLALVRTSPLTTSQMPANTGDGVAYFATAQTVPTANPVSGFILYVDGNGLRARGPSGTVTTIAAP